MSSSLTAPPTPAPRRPPAPPKYHSLTLPSCVSMIPPAVRLVVVQVWVHNGETGHEILPVVALQSRIEHEYTRIRDGGEPLRSVDPARLERAGWSFEESRVKLDPVIIDPESGGLSTAEDSLFGADNVLWRLVPAPWDPSEDESRLAGLIASVEREAIEKERRERGPVSNQGDC